MSKTHTIQQGEHLPGIAQKYGFRSYEVIWTHPKNADLKKRRVNPNVLYPGNVLFIPDKQEKTVGCTTAAVHSFQVKVPELKLSVIVRDRAGKPLANADCELEVDGAKYQLKSDGNGLVEKEISPAALGGTLRVPDLQIEAPLKIGHLDPLDETSGLAARLANLGYYNGDLEKPDDDQLSSALEEFQCDQGIEVDGKFGPQTKAKLNDFHGC